MNDNQKLRAIRKVMEDIKDLSSLGESNNDTQINFIADTMKVVLLAGNDAEHAMVMSRHIHNFLSELQMMQGDITATEVLIDEPIYEN
jgi:hypothetical protein